MFYVQQDIFSFINNWLKQFCVSTWMNDIPFSSTARNNIYINISNFAILPLVHSALSQMYSSLF